MSIRTSNGPSFVGCQKIEKLIESGPDAIARWLDGDDSDACHPTDYNGWSGVAFQLAHVAQHAEERSVAIAFGELACRVYEEILPDHQNELACVGLVCDGALTEVEGMQLRVRMIARYGETESVDLLNPDVIATWFDPCRKKLSALRELANRELLELEVEEIARLRFAKNRIGILRSLPEQSITAELRAWVKLYDELP
jgi:hypothetical protein